MRETPKIVGKSVNELLGAVIGEHTTLQPYPGLAPLAHKLSDLVKQAIELERESYELRQIRATLLLNFGVNSPHNRYGVGVTDDLSTIHMLIRVLEHCCSLALCSVEGKKNG